MAGLVINENALWMVAEGTQCRPSGVRGHEAHQRPRANDRMLTSPRLPCLTVASGRSANQQEYGKKSEAHKTSLSLGVAQLIQGRFFFKYDRDHRYKSCRENAQG